MLNFSSLENIPDSIAKYIVLMMFVLPLVFALTMKKKYIYAGAEDTKGWRNLKYWVFFLCLIMTGLYLYF